MAIVIQDVVDKATILGQITDPNTLARLPIIAEQVILKVEEYIGYEAPVKLTNTVAEIVVTEINHYNGLQGSGGTASGATKRISRGDYTVEYDTSAQAPSSQVDVFNSYEWILKKYKKLRSL